MTYYEELGVPPDAPPDTIREAYRIVARLLHPDGQTNPVLKESAEVQMKRINHLYETLADAERRRRYDRELAGPAECQDTIIIQAPPPAERFERGHGGTAAWLAATAICATFIIWLATRDTSAPVVYPQHQATAEPSALRRAAEAILPMGNTDRQRDNEIGRLRGELAAANADRERLNKQIADMQATHRFQPPPVEPRQQVQFIPPASIQSAPTPPPEIPLPSVALSPPSPPQSRWAGSWMYRQPQVSSTNRALLPPVFIETVLHEEGGRLRGQYHARFQVADPKVSPDVDFHFEGMVNGSSARFAWAGTDGARGEVQLRLISDTALEVTWSATDLGKSMGLASGTAVLNRKK